MNIPRNWEFGSALAKFRGGGVWNPPSVRHCSGAKFRLAQGVRKICSSYLNDRADTGMCCVVSGPLALAKEGIWKGRNLRWRILFAYDSETLQHRGQWWVKIRLNQNPVTRKYSCKFDSLLPPTHIVDRREFSPGGPTVNAACCRDAERLWSGRGWPCTSREVWFVYNIKLSRRLNSVKLLPGQ
jgi:hypothetical protein